MPSGSGDPAARAAVVCLINSERAKAGLREVKVNPKLEAAAGAYAARLVAEHFYSHVDPAGGTVERRIRASGYLSGAWLWGLGENLAWGSGSRSTPAAIVTAWMGSPLHRANILMREWRDLGVGQSAGNPYGNLGSTWAAEFGERISKPKQAHRKHRVARKHRRR